MIAVLQRRLIEDIDIPREPGESVKDDRLCADDHEADLMLEEEEKEILNVLSKMGRHHLD